MIRLSHNPNANIKKSLKNMLIITDVLYLFKGFLTTVRRKLVVE